MPVERNIGSTSVDAKPIIRITTPIEARSLERAVVITNTLADAKEFSLDTADAVDSEGPYSVTYGGGKCMGPCVQRCLPPPPRPPTPPPKCR